MKQPDYKKNIAVVIKIGDNGPYKHLSIVDYYDYDDWYGKPPVLSDHMGKVYGIVEVPRTYKQNIKDMMALNNSYTAVESTKTRIVLDSDVVGDELISDWQSEKTVDPVKQSGVWVFKSAECLSVTKDFNVVASGSYTVGGGVGDDYATWAAAATDVAAILTGDLTFTQTTATTEVANCLFSSAIDIKGYTLTLESNNPHYGDPTAGNLISLNGAIWGIWVDVSDTAATAGTVEIKHLYEKRVAAGGATSMYECNGRNVNINFSIHDCLADGNSIDGSRGQFRFSDARGTWECYNCVAWDGQYGYFVRDGANKTIENCAAYSVQFGGFELWNLACTVRNCVSFDNGTDYSNHVNATGRYNVSSDATATNANWGAGVGNIPNTAAAACVQSVDDTNSTFFDILVGGTLIGAGEANTIAERTTCIRNRAVPGPSGTSIGVAEEITPEPPEPTTSTRVYTSHIRIPCGIAIQ